VRHCPSSEVEFRPRVARPTVWSAVGPWVFLREFLGSFAFVFYEGKRVFPGCLGDPSWLSPTGRSLGILKLKSS
jgi:hypothetical protein